MKTNANRNLGEALKALREHNELTQVQLAAKLKQPQSYISKIENGERSLHAYEVFDYAKSLGITPYELVDALEKALKN